MNIKNSLIIFFLIALQTTQVEASNPCRNFKLLIYGQLNGEIAPCPCGGNQKGGLAKLKTAIFQRRKAFKHTVVISQGNLLSYTGEKEKDSLILQVMPRFGFDASAIGWAEMIEGSEYFHQNMNPGKMNWVSCNIYYKGKPLAPVYRIIESGDIRLGVTSVASPVLFNSPLLKGRTESIDILPVIKKVDETIKALKKKVDYIIIMTQLDPKTEKMLYGKYKTEPMVVFSRSSSAVGRDKPAEYGFNKVFNSGERGRYLTSLGFDKTKGIISCDTILLDNKFAEDPEIKAIVDEIGTAQMPITADTDQAIIKMLTESAKGKRGDRFIFYYSPACPDCHQIMEKYLVKMKEKRGFKLELVDVSESGNYNKLLEMQRKYKTSTREIPVALYKGVFYDGKDQITALLNEIIK